MNRQTSALLILMLLAAGAAQAGTYSGRSRADTWEFTVQTRYSWAQDYTADNGSKLSLEDDLGWGFGFGYCLSEQFNVGFTFAWRSLYYKATIVSVTDPTDTRTYGNYLDTSTFAVTGDYTFGKGRFKPYLAGNLGWLALNTNITADVDVGCWYYPYLGYVCSAYTQTYGTDAFTYGLGLGLRFDLTTSAFLRAGWDHQWNDLDAMDSTDLMRIEIGFGM